MNGQRFLVPAFLIGNAVLTVMPLAVSVAAPVPTNLAGIMAHVAVPQMFNAVTASPEQLAANGFPPRPGGNAGPAALQQWQRAVTAGSSRILPRLSHTAVAHGPKISRGKRNGTEYSNNWSGYALVNNATSYGASSFYYVLADYVVPPANQPFGACTGDWVYSSSWVGIDGWNSNDVLQAGTETDAYCSGGQKATDNYAWIEWYPYNEALITNFPVAAGDDIFVEVWNSSPTAGYAYLVNFHTGQSVSLSIAAPPGTSLIGNSAEWVVERPGVNGTLSNLTNYSQDFFANTYAGDFMSRTSDPGYAVPGTTSIPIVMVDNAGSPISVPNLFGLAGLWFYDENSALTVNLP